jgi:serine/threonine protein kinase
MAKCASCGLELSSGVRFCPSCGTAVSNTDDVATISIDAASGNAASPYGARLDEATLDEATIDFATPRSPRPPSRSPSSSSSRISSSAEYLLNEGRFLPGRLVASRYRIIALLGKGGMGEVYRADDLTLGQAVAMKFLPDDAGRDEGLLERFRNEVRMARRVSHPNVCRVYDVGDVEGQTFFTMEYIDGEDLGSLLRRIGRLPPDKALDIARHLCAGLAAAHAKGVLHRDLKPANIMLDGRGQVVITDFGLAGVAEDIRGAEVRSGTPAYMSPEQLSGKEVSPRSDIYALGLVLYEVFTGKRAFSEKLANSPKLVAAGVDRTPSRPSSVVKDLDPIVEKVILRCLEIEPSARPATALAVAAALPGGDPLAAALAAGETPSPQLVAASGETAGLRPRTAVACLIFVLVGLAVGAYLTVRYSGVEKMHLEQTPEVLAHKAREILAQAGYPEKPADSAFGFDYDTNFRDSVEKEQKTAADWDEIMAGRPTMLLFWYRQSPDLLGSTDYRDMLLIPGVVGEEDPPTTLSGMVNLKLDAKGRLIYLQAIPPQKESAKESPKESSKGSPKEGAATTSSTPDWSALFSAAELDASKLQPAPPEWTSLGAADTRAAWTGVWPGTNRPLRVEAAAWHGKPVFFAMIGEWNKPWRMINPESADEKKNRAGNIIGISILIFILGMGALLARRNYRRGRGDREGALRLATVLFVLELVLWLCRSHFVAGFQTFGYLMLAIAAGLLWGGTMWMLYLAIEPWIRRYWPQAIISWSRIVAGQWRDAVVGRDILFGVAFGTLWIVIFESSYIPLARMGAAPPLPSEAYLTGGRHALGHWATQIPFSIFATLQFFFVLLGLKVLLEFLLKLVGLKGLRGDWIAAVLFVAIFVGTKSLQSTHLAVDVPVIFLIYGILALIVLRFGLVALAVGAFTVDMLGSVPFTADFSAWYASATLLALLSVVALAGWGFYHSLGGEPLWRAEEE